MILHSIHQPKLVAQAADRLPPAQRGDFITGVAVRLSRFVKYSDADVSRACRLALRALERVEA
jgi:hypothetical protein